MNNAKSWSRRAVIKASAVAGGTMLLSGIIGATDQGLATKYDTGIAGGALADPLLHGVCDIHVHAAPDTRERSIDELSFAHEAQKAGYRAVMFKSNEWSCHDRAWLVQQAFPNFACFGSLCMNRVHGDKVNVYAAEQAVKTTGGLCRCIWMPTTHAAYQHAHEKRTGKGIPVLDDMGEVLPEVVRVMEICAEADIIFATGHCSPNESLVLAQKARDVGVKKFVVTHANSGIWRMTPSQITQVAKLGGYIEYSYITDLWGAGTGLPDYVRMSNEDFVAYTRIVPERSFITTDLGQVGMPHPLEGMRLCIQALQNAGVPQKDVDIMVRANPAYLVGLA